MNCGPVHSAYVLFMWAVDLARACWAHEMFVAWLALLWDSLRGSAGIANYLASAALAFEEQAHPLLRTYFDAFDARDNLADTLTASAPLSSDELCAAVATAIREASARSLKPATFVRTAHTSRCPHDWSYPQTGSGHYRQIPSRRDRADFRGSGIGDCN
jgi:hypothetical protein